ncbi:MAG: hypothetical protein ACPL7R_08035 [Anaerolineae bacterium]
MKRLLSIVVIMILVALVAAPAMAEPPADSKDTIKLKVYVHYPKPGKPQPQPGVCDPTQNETSNYGLAGWKRSGTVVYRVNYSSIPSTVTQPQPAINNSFEVWEQYTGGKVDFVEGAPTTLTRYKRDGVNLVAWGQVSASGAIAVTYTWYNSSTGEAVEQDVIMNVKLPWKQTYASNPDATCGDLYAYDVQNILTHEVGHWVGLDDLYNSADQDLTMYGYGDKGELKKVTLGLGDIAGMNALY